MNEWRNVNDFLGEPSAIRYDDHVARMVSCLANDIRHTERVMGMAQPEVLFILTCTHVMKGRAGTEKVFCYECDKWMPIADVHIYEWKAECKHPRCHWARWSGLSRHLGTVMANSHAKNRPGHDVIVPYKPNPVAVRVRERMVTNELI